MSKAPRGFSLIELVIAISLASFVLIGVTTIAAQMVRNQVDGMRAGTVTGWSTLSYAAMVKEIEDANVLAFPINDGDVADQLIICKNWSRVSGAKLDTNGPALVSVVQYCVDTTAPVAPETGFRLFRYANVGAGVTCPSPGAPVACTSLTPTGTWTQLGVVGFRLEKLAGANVFQRVNAVGGVRIRYVMGSQTATANQPVPKFMPFDVSVSMDKTYGASLD